MNSTGQDDESFRVEIEKSDGGTIVRIVGLSVSTDKTQFDNAYKLVSELHKRTLKLDEDLKREHEIQYASKQMKSFWTQDSIGYKLSSTISEPSYRIALSLLKTYPLCITQSIVIKETGIAQKTVSNHLGGKKKTVRKYFTGCDEGGYQLTEAGLDWTIREIIPTIIGENESNNEEGD